MDELDAVCAALSTIRAPLQRGEYDLHALVMGALTAAGLSCEHEVRLAPGCRIDLMCGGVGIEIKRGKPPHAALIGQLRRYAACGQVKALCVVCERSAALPHAMEGKPVRSVCLNRLWGIAL